MHPSPMGPYCRPQIMQRRWSSSAIRIASGSVIRTTIGSRRFRLYQRMHTPLDPVESPRRGRLFLPRIALRRWVLSVVPGTFYIPGKIPRFRVDTRRSRRGSRHSARAPVSVTLLAMDLFQTESLVRDLEHAPSQVQAYYAELERAISWLMDRTFESDCPDEKVRLAAIELRARGVLECWKQAAVN